jgi:preprotein translocase subunit SecA
MSHQLLTTHNREHEADILADAGRKGAVTVATNIHRSLVDIRLGGAVADPAAPDEVVALGGLVVIGSERRVSRRADNRLRDQCARRGDPGESFFMPCKADTLFSNVTTWRLSSLAGDAPPRSTLLNRAFTVLQRITWQWIWNKGSVILLMTASKRHTGRPFTRCGVGRWTATTSMR